MRLLQAIFGILFSLGSLGNGILFLYIEWSFVRQSFIQVFNPFLQFQVVGVLLTHPLFWVFLAVALVSHYAVTRIEKYLEKGKQATRVKASIAVSPLPQTVKEIQHIPSAPSAPSEPTYSAPPQPFPKPVSEHKRGISQEVIARPYIKFRIDELEKITASEWNSAKGLSEILYELEFRSRKKALNLRERIAARLAQLRITKPEHATSSIDFPDEEGILRRYGYKVGINGLPEKERWEILDAVFLRPLLQMEQIDDAAYLSAWGKPNSAKRLQKLANSIAAFTRLAKGRSRGNFSKAIQDWETDLAYLKKTYYNSRFSFQYPRT